MKCAEIHPNLAAFLLGRLESKEATLLVGGGRFSIQEHYVPHNT